VVAHGRMMTAEAMVLAEVAAWVMQTAAVMAMAAVPTAATTMVAAAAGGTITAKVLSMGKGMAAMSLGTGAQPTAQARDESNKQTLK